MNTAEIIQFSCFDTEMVEGNTVKLPALNFNFQYFNNTKMFRILTSREFSVTEDLFKMPVKVADNIINLVEVKHDPHIDLTNWDITPFDSAVMDATYTLLSAGYKFITPEWIAQVISGTKNVDNISPSKIAAVKESVEKLRSILIKIDCTAEYNAYCLKKGQKPSKWYGWNTYLIPAGIHEISFKANGRKKIAYEILEKPALYCYAEMNRQMVKVPAVLLESTGRSTNTDEASLIRRYVVKRVAQIVKKNNLKNNKISFLWFDKDENELRGLFPELGYKPDGTAVWRMKKKRIVDVVTKTLDSLIEGGSITRYELYREDGSDSPTSSIAGFKIFYDRK